MKLEFGDKLEFGLCNSSFLDSCSIKPEVEKPDTKKNRGRRRSANLKKNRGSGRQSRALKKNRGRRSKQDDLAREEQTLGGEKEEEEE